MVDSRDVNKPTQNINRLATGLIFYALLIIAWGAWVRISGSGDGCGKHWPLCQGEILISEEFTATAKIWIEYLHRIKSGIFGLLVLYLGWIARKSAKEIKYSAFCTVFFTITESLLGAKLVLWGLVGADDSLYRAMVASLHLVNTLFLLASLVICSRFSSASSGFATSLIRSKEGRLMITISAICIILLSLSGAWASLASTLFPSSSIVSGIQTDLEKSIHPLLRLRIVHPLLGLTLSFAMIYACSKIFNLSRTTASRVLLALAIVQPLFGASTLLALSPVWMKLVHLIIADSLWCTIIWCALSPVGVTSVESSNTLLENTEQRLKSSSAAR